MCVTFLGLVFLLLTVSVSILLGGGVIAHKTAPQVAYSAEVILVKRITEKIILLKGLSKGFCWPALLLANKIQETMFLNCAFYQGTIHHDIIENKTEYTLIKPDQI